LHRACRACRILRARHQSSSSEGDHQNGPDEKQQNSQDYKRTFFLAENRATGLLNLIIVVAICAVAYTDKIVVEDDSLGYLYLLPIALSGLVNRLPVTIALAMLCAFLQELFGPPTDTLHVRVLRNVISLAGYLIVSFFVTRVATQRGKMAADIRQQRDDYERDLTLASQVQRQVLPKPPIVPGIELAAAMQTARPSAATTTTSSRSPTHRRHRHRRRLR
jgi:K+-sensing histidine kinase KdpD